MSVSTEITRISNARNTIREKAVELGIATSTDRLDALATKIDDIVDRGTPEASVAEGETYTIQSGYYHGGTVTGISGGGSYTLQAKTNILPKKTSQSVTPDSGYYGLSSVGIAPIPDIYQDVSGVTATAADVLATKVIVNSLGQQVAGSMVNNGAVSKTLDATTGNQQYSVPAGYHNGSGKVLITLEQKSATPTKSTQTISPTTGKVLSSVTVNPIPAQYGDATNANAAAGDIISGKKAVVIVSGTATLITGTMASNGAISQTIDGLTSMTATIPAGYTSGGTVSLTNDIETALAAI